MTLFNAYLQPLHDQSEFGHVCGVRLQHIFLWWEPLPFNMIMKLSLPNFAFSRTSKEWNYSLWSFVPDVFHVAFCLWHLFVKEYFIPFNCWVIFYWIWLLCFAYPFTNAFPVSAEMIILIFFPLFYYYVELHWLVFRCWTNFEFLG